MKQTYQSEYGLLKSILLKKPKEAYRNEAMVSGQWKDLNYTEKPNYLEAINEYNNFVKLISKTGASVHFMDVNEETSMDSIYVRDASICTDMGMIICNMGKEARLPEPKAQGKFYEDMGFPVLGHITAPGTIEGGDVAWIDDHTLAVGHGYRTNKEGIRQIRKLLSEFAEVVEVHLPHFRGPSDVFHLMSTFSPVDKDLAVVYSPLMTVPFRELLVSKGYDLVEVTEEEFDSIGCNVLALAPRKCLILKGNPITKKRLEQAGAEVIEYSGAEISLKGCGGPTCLTRPLLRN